MPVLVTRRPWSAPAYDMLIAGARISVAAVGPYVGDIGMWATVATRPANGGRRPGRRRSAAVSPGFINMLSWRRNR